MSYDRTSIYVTWGGRIGGAGSDEIWQCGLHLAVTGSTSLAPGLPDLAKMADFYALAMAQHENADLATSSGATLTWAKAAFQGTDGAQVGETVIYEGTATAGPVSAGGISSTPQDAMCVTLWSGMTTQRANYGRYYLPWSCLVVAQADGQIGAYYMGLAATAVHTFLDGVNDWADGLANTPDVAILSGVGAGQTKRANKIKMGSVKDTQRRRRNRIPEVYTVLDLA